MFRQQVSNRYREYTIALPSHVADKVKALARAEKISEQELIKRMVHQAIFAMPANEMAEAQSA